MIKDHLIRAGHGAETADRMEREAWPTERMIKSAYAYLLDFPAEIRAGDRQTAHFVYKQIQVAMAKGGWTTNEWNRLHAMARTWRRRAEGRDRKFSVMGWQKQGDGQHTPEVVKVMEEIQGEIDGLADHEQR